MNITLGCVSGCGRWPPPTKWCLFCLTKNCNAQEGANKDYHFFHISSVIFNAHTHSGPCLGTHIKSRQCGMWSSNVFSQTAKTNDLPTPNGSGKIWSYQEKLTDKYKNLYSLWFKGTEHSFTDAKCKGQDQKWALWQSTPFHDPPSFAGWTAVTTHPSLSYTDTVGQGRRS